MRKKKKVSHGGTATTAFLEEGEKRFVRSGLCVAVRNIHEFLDFSQAAVSATPWVRGVRGGPRRAKVFSMGTR